MARAHSECPFDSETLLGQLSGVSITRASADKKGYFIQIIPHIAGEKGLICNHQRNADRLETRLHSIILIQIQDLFWRSFFNFFLLFLWPQTRLFVFTGHPRHAWNQTIHKHGSDSAAPVVNFKVAWLPGLTLFCVWKLGCWGETTSLKHHSNF